MSSVIFHNFDRKLTVEEIEDEIFHRKREVKQTNDEEHDSEVKANEQDKQTKVERDDQTKEDELLGGLYTDNPYEFILTNEDHDETDNVISSNKINFMKHQIIPKLYFLSNHTDCLLLNYGMGTGKTIAALNIINEFHQQNKRSLILKKESKEEIQSSTKLFIVGEWQSKDSFFKDIMKQDLNFFETNFEMTTETKRKEISKDISYLTLQGLYNTIFPSDAIIQQVEVLRKSLANKKVFIKKTTLEKFKDSVIVVDEINKLYSSNSGLNTYGIALSQLVRVRDKYNIKFIYLTGTLFNSTTEELMSLIEIIQPEIIPNDKENIYLSSDFSDDMLRQVFRDKLIVYKPSYKTEIALTYKCNNELMIDSQADIKKLKQIKDDPLIKNNPMLSGLDFYLTKGIIQQFSENIDYANIKEYNDTANEIIKLIKNKIKNKEKIVIYSDELDKYGLNFYDTLFNNIGLLPYGLKSTQETLCKVCLNKKRDCKCAIYKPIVYGKITGATLLEERHRLIDVYNKLDNIYGDTISVLLVSSVGQVGISLNNTNNIIITNESYNFSRLLQTVYRVIRTNSHAALEDDRKFVDVYIMTEPTSVRSYIEKLQNYTEVLQLEEKLKSLSLFDGAFEHDNRECIERLKKIKLVDEIKVLNKIIENEFVDYLDKIGFRHGRTMKLKNLIKYIRETSVDSVVNKRISDSEILNLLIERNRIEIFALVKNSVKESQTETVEISDKNIDTIQELYVKRIERQKNKIKSGQRFISYDSLINSFNF